LAEHSEDFAIL